MRLGWWLSFTIVIWNPAWESEQGGEAIWPIQMNILERSPALQSGRNSSGGPGLLRPRRPLEAVKALRASVDEARFQELFGKQDWLTLASHCPHRGSVWLLRLVFPDGHFGILRLEIQNGNHFGEMVTCGLHFWRVQSLHPWARGCQDQGQELEVGALLSSFSSTSFFSSFFSFLTCLHSFLSLFFKEILI